MSDTAIAIILGTFGLGILLSIARALDKMRTRTLVVLLFVLAIVFTATWMAAR